MATKKTSKTNSQAAKADAGIKPAKTRAAKAPLKPAKANADPKKLGALDAAAKVLGETGQALNCRELIEKMAAKRYWTSPGGKTPHATLSAAIAREIKLKGADSRFVKAERGKFARNG